MDRDESGGWPQPGGLSDLGAVVSILSGGRVRRIDWVKAARQPRAGGFGAGGDGGSAGD